MTQYILARIEAMQQELEGLSKVIAREITGPRRKTKLKGLWKGIQVTEEDLEEAQRAIFKDAYAFEE